MTEIKECIEIHAWLKKQGVDTLNEWPDVMVWQDEFENHYAATCAFEAKDPAICPYYPSASNSLKALHALREPMKLDLFRCGGSGVWMAYNYETKALEEMKEYVGKGKTDDEALFNLLKAVKEASK